MNLTWMYVGVVYALAVWLARRAGSDVPWRIAGLFYALVVLFMFQAMTGPYVNFPADFLRTLPPWSHVQPHIGNFEMNDVPLQMVPWAHQVRESWKHLELPLWNARAGSGYPLLANGQSAALSFIRILALPLDLGHSMTAEAAMKILIALTFTFLLCRRRRYGELPSTVAAVGFGFGTFLTVWLHFPHTTVVCLLPATLYAIELLVDRLTYGRVVFAAFVWVAILFGGHPESAAHIFFIALLYLIWLLVVEQLLDMRGAVRLVLGLSAAMILAAVLASPFLVTFAQGLTKSNRYQQLHAGERPAGFDADWKVILLVFEPHFFGDVPSEKPFGPEHPELITAFTGILGIAASLGLLLHAIVARRFRSREFFFVLATWLLLGILLGWPVIGMLFQKLLPMAANGRLRFALGFLFAMQAAAALDLLARSVTLPSRERQQVTLPLLGGLGAVSLALLCLVHGVTFDRPWQLGSTVLALLPGLIVLALAALAVLAGPRSLPAALMVVLVAVTAEVMTMSIDWNPPVHEREVFPMTPLIRKMLELKQAAPAGQPFRVTGIDAMFFPNPNAYYGLDDVRVHDPMANGRYLGVLRIVSGFNPSDYFAKWQDVDSPLLDYLNVRYLAVSSLVEVKDHQRWGLVYEGKDGLLYENHSVLPRFFSTPAVVLEFKQARFVERLTSQHDWGTTAVLRRLHVSSDQERTDLLAPRPKDAPRATVRIVEAADIHYRLMVEAPRHSMVVSSIPLWPGWHVTANGRRLDPVEVNGAFLGFVVPPGTSSVEVWFAPRSFQIAFAVMLLTAAVLALFSRRSLRLRLRSAVRPGSVSEDLPRRKTALPG